MKFPDDPTPKEKTTVADLLLLGLIILFIVIPIAVVVLLIKAVVITLLWDWYIVAHFNVTELPIAVAFGISLLMSYLTHSPYHGEDKRSIGQKIGTGVAQPAVFLLVGWIGTFFI